MAKRSAQDRNPKRVWIGLGALVVVLAGVVVWSLPGPEDMRGTAEPPPAPEEDGGKPEVATRDAAPKATGVLERLPEATCELAILTDKPREEVEKVDVDALEKRLDAKLCGSGCDAVKKAMRDKARFELEVTTAEAYILPPAEAFEAMGPTLSKAERESLGKRPNVLVVRTHFPPTIDQLAARACFTAGAAAAYALSGIVYDETTRRFETASQLAQHSVMAPLGKPVFVPKMIAVQLAKHDDGGARLVTLGMNRFGAPDFVVRGTTMESGNAVANVVNVAAWHAAAMEGQLPIVVTLADVSRVAGMTGEQLSKEPATSQPLKLEAVEAERTEGDPDNDLTELVPPGGSTPDAWGAALEALYRAKP